ncbi:NAD(P)H-binding protein [Streptomyces sodiiphilus]|uniref:NAD(P)H-binding protein n=1 Tax=Streptomyces sodiiphilus TaxID=226217 RepID=A0ABN2PJ87_9ACTN
MNDVTVVTGGTGVLGSAVVRRLLMDERPVRVLSRRPRPEGDRLPVEWAVGDLKSGEGLDAAVDGAAAIVHCATTGGRADARLTRTLVAAAGRTGRPHLVHVSVVGADRVPDSFHRAKLAAEEAVTGSGLPWSVLRTTRFHDRIARSARSRPWLPVVLTLAGDVPLQPVEPREVAERLAALAAGEPTGAVEEMGGPQIRTASELTRAALRAQGRHRPVVALRWPGRTSGRLRDGGLLTAEHADGRATLEDHLARGEPPGVVTMVEPAGGRTEHPSRS